jgi:formate dehydrogenase subunit gamma
MKPGYRRRFSRTERTLHWANAAFFFFLLATGLILYLPRLSIAVGRRPLIRGVLRDLREVDDFDRDDFRWLTGHKAPQGRFNAGQKLNTVLNLGFTVLFLVTGLLLWFGERNTELRFASTVILHDGLMYVSVVLLLGHLYLALIHPTTRHALRGITTGTVSEEWAAVHHGKWTE